MLFSLFNYTETTAFGFSDPPYFNTSALSPRQIALPFQSLTDNEAVCLNDSPFPTIMQNPDTTIDSLS